MHRRYLALVGFILLIGLSGCATVSVTAEVGDANTMDRYEMNITTSTTVYGFLNTAAQEEGYEDLEDQLVGEVPTDSDQIEYSEEIDGNEARIHFAATDIPINSSSSASISVEESGGELVYKDRTFLNESAEPAESEMASQMMSGFVLDYTLRMPGDITNSTADEVDGNTATWTRTGETTYMSTNIRARSETGSQFPVPGFGVSAAAIAIASAALLGARRRL